MILLKIYPKIALIGIWMGHFFLRNWYLYGSTFKFCGGTSLPNLSTRGGGVPSISIHELFYFHVNQHTGYFHMNLYTLCGRLNQNVAQRVCESLKELANPFENHTPLPEYLW